MNETINTIKMQYISLGLVLFLYYLPHLITFWLMEILGDNNE